MAITIQTQPQPLSPGYNPVVYAFSGTNNMNSGYRYLVDIYSGNTTGSTIAQLRVTPTPFGDGYVDVSRILNNLVSVDFDGNSTSDSNASNSYLNFSARIGEEYLYQWPYNIVTSASTGTFTRYVILSGATTGATPLYTSGDQIEVITTSTGATAVVNGLHTIVTATSNSITIDIIYPSALTTATTLNVSGNTTYADRRNAQFSALTSSTGTTIFNGALDWPDWQSWAGTDYTLQYISLSASKRMLTSLNNLGSQSNTDNRFFMTPSQNIWVNFYTDTAQSAHSVTTQLLNVDGSVATSASFVITNTFSGSVKQFKIGFTALGYVPTKGQSLKFYVTGAGGLQISRSYTVYADTRCLREETKLYYMDRFGSILSQSFTLNSTENINVDRQTIKKAIIYGANASLDLSQSGSLNVNVDLDRTYTLQTDWLSQGNIDMMEELISSRYVWMQISGGYIPVIVQDNGYEITQQRNKRLLRKTVIVQLANQQPLN